MADPSLWLWMCVHVTVSALCESLRQVDGVDLRDASHEQAVEAIRKAGNPVLFLVQSIVHRPRVCFCPVNTHTHTQPCSIMPLHEHADSTAGLVVITSFLLHAVSQAPPHSFTQWNIILSCMTLTFDISLPTSIH